MKTRGEILEGIMSRVFNELQEAEVLTEGKIDLEFLLSIVGSYITAKKDDKLTDGHKAPSELFDERIFPIVDESEITKEDIVYEEDEDGE